MHHLCVVDSPQVLPAFRALRRVSQCASSTSVREFLFSFPDTTAPVDSVISMDLWKYITGLCETTVQMGVSGTLKVQHR